MNFLMHLCLWHPEPRVSHGVHGGNRSDARSEDQSGDSLSSSLKQPLTQLENKTDTTDTTDTTDRTDRTDRTPPIVLTIAGSDPSGGAGLEADLKTFTSLGAYGAVVTTGITIQNTMGVRSVYPLPPLWVREQASAVCGDLQVVGIKIGALINVAIVEAVIEVIAQVRSSAGGALIPIVLDPVMVATSGDRLLTIEAEVALRRLASLVTVITPNRAEAEAILSHESHNNDINDINGINDRVDRNEPLATLSLAALAVRLAAVMPPSVSVLVKGGDNPQDREAIDVLVHKGVIHEIASPLVETRHTHGTGCTLAAAITVALAQGVPLLEAVIQGKTFVNGGLLSARAWLIGKGRGPLDHHWYWRQNHHNHLSAGLDGCLGLGESSGGHKTTSTPLVTHRVLTEIPSASSASSVSSTKNVHHEIVSTRRKVLLGITTLGVGSTLGAVSAMSGLPSTVARAQGRDPSTPITLRMVTSWPKNAVGPGQFAESIAQTVARWSQGRLQIQVFAAGELVPAFEVFDAVQQGLADMAHTAAVFWQGKMSASAFFTSIPFGFDPSQHEGWLRYGGGMSLWRELYEPALLTPMSAGNTGSNVLGWFQRPLTAIDQVRGLRIRVSGLGALLWQEMGASPVLLAPGETFAALRQGTVDAAEFAGLATDVSMGIQKVAKFVHVPGFHEPNGTSELLIRTNVLQNLAPADRACLEDAVRAVNDAALIEMVHANALTHQDLLTKNVNFVTTPEEIVDHARKTMLKVLREMSNRDPMFLKVWEGYYQYARHIGHPIGRWSV